DLASLDLLSLETELATRLSWGRRRVDLPAGKYETILPPAAVADLMTYMHWMMDGRPAQEGRSAFSAPPGSDRATRVGERLNSIPFTLTTDPLAGDGLSTAPFLATTFASDEVSIFDNGAPLRRVDWIADGVVNALVYPRAAAAEFGTEFAAPGDNLL